MNNPTVIDLFCGAGGFSYGLKKAEFDVLLGIDNTAHKLETYKKTLLPQLSKKIFN